MADCISSLTVVLADRCDLNALSINFGGHEHLFRVESAARGVFRIEGLVAQHAAQPLTIEVDEPAFQRLEGKTQVRQGFVRRAVQPGGPARRRPVISFPSAWPGRVTPRKTPRPRPASR